MAQVTVYMIPGQGADHRLYKNIEIDSRFELRHIKYVTPLKGWSMKDYAKELSKQIDTSRKFILMGVSLGGMLSIEMADFLSPEKVILISSAKQRHELPARYRFQKAIPVYKLFPGGVIKAGAKILQPVVEPASKTDKETFRSMLDSKSKQYMKRTVSMILEWEREEYKEGIIHIHGDKDHTIPVKNVKYDYLVEGGSHMMILTKGDELSKILNRVLLKN